MYARLGTWSDGCPLAHRNRPLAHPVLCAPQPTLSSTVSPPTVIEDSGTPITVVFTITSPPAAAFSLKLKATNSGAAPASFGTDYSLIGTTTASASTSVDFGPSQTQKAIQIVPIPDSIQEPAETVTLEVQVDPVAFPSAPPAMVITATIINKDNVRGKCTWDSYVWRLEGHAACLWLRFIGRLQGNQSRGPA
jgi:hypothetical protein